MGAMGVRLRPPHQNLKAGLSPASGAVQGHGDTLLDTAGGPMLTAPSTLAPCGRPCGRPCGPLQALGATLRCSHLPRFRASSSHGPHVFLLARRALPLLPPHLLATTCWVPLCQAPCPGCLAESPCSQQILGPLRKAQLLLQRCFAALATCVAANTQTRRNTHMKAIKQLRRRLCRTRHFCVVTA